MDAFYASVELRKHPELRGQPVVVCGSGPRAVVTTASYEARKLAGIHSAMPAAVARRRLPNAVYLPPDFPAYREASAVVMEVLRANVEVVEVVGLDEAYLELTGIFSPKATMRRIKAEIRELTGLTCSVGISESRMLAKMTSELGKPNGLVVISHEEAMARFGAGRPASSPGSGRKRRNGWKSSGSGASRRSASGTGATSKRGSGPAPAPGCTPAATSATRRRSASAARPNRSRWRRPSTSTSRAGGAGADAPRADRGALPAAQKKELEGRSIGIKVRLDDWTNITRSQSVESPTNDPEVVWPIALDLLRAYDPPRPVRLLGVRLASFENEAEAAAEEDEPQLRLTLPGCRRAFALSDDFSTRA